jgi:hypothetical protein
MTLTKDSQFVQFTKSYWGDQTSQGVGLEWAEEKYIRRVRWKREGKRSFVRPRG